jgi:SNF2 family DNA or RNA helicase
MLRGLTGTVVSNKPGDLLEIMRCLRLEGVFAMAFPDPQLERQFKSWYLNNLTDEQLAAQIPPGYMDRFKFLFWEWFSRPKGRRTPPQGAKHEALLKMLRPVRISRLRRHVLSHLPPVQYEEVPVKLTKRTMAEVEEAVQRMLAVRRAHGEVKDGLIPDPWGKKLVAGRWKKLDPDEKDRRKRKFEERVDYYFDSRPWVRDTELREAVKEALESRNESPAFEELARIRAILSLAKVNTALAYVEKHEDGEQPAIFFCQHVAVLERLFTGREGWALYTGKVPQRKRDQIVQDFQAGKIRHGVGISITAGGEGVTLTRAGFLNFLDLHWNPAKNKQSEARVQRPGAEIHDKIVIRHFVANHAVDRLVKLTVDEKGDLHLAMEDTAASRTGL